jgi:hypothetical protein
VFACGFDPCLSAADDEDLGPAVFDVVPVCAARVLVELAAARPSAA